MKKIIIVSTNAIGDTYLSCSAIDNIKNQMGDVEFDLVTLSDSMCFAELMIFRNLHYVKKRTVGNLLLLRSRLIKYEYDYAFSFFPGRFNSLIMNLIKAKNKYYYKNRRKVVDWHRSKQYLFVNNKKTSCYWNSEMNFLDRINIPLENLFSIPQKVKKPKFDTLIENIKSELKYVIINYKSRDARKTLPIYLIDELVCFIENDLTINVKVLNFGDSLKLKSENIYSVKEDTQFSDLLKLILNSSLFISIDSFLIHIADAYDIKILGLFNLTFSRSVLQSNNAFSLNYDSDCKSNVNQIKFKIKELLKNE
ncbi:MAG: hypothetical protein NTV87_02700 [Ignavibacteriae bacterium]|nr:hypothetical protein [Ignavibacteriota bacterium]